MPALNAGVIDKEKNQPDKFLLSNFREASKRKITTLRMGYTSIETERAGRRACAKARATTGTALVKHYALRYAFPKN